MILNLGIEKEISELNIPARSFPWRRGLKEHQWICEQAPNRAVVYRNSLIGWYACIKRDNYFWKGETFRSPAPAFEWVENELVQLQNEQEEPGPVEISKEVRQAERSQLLERLASDPTSIQPAQLEPESIHYQVMLEVRAKPHSNETMEDSCGDTMLLGKKYHSWAKMAVLLLLNIDHYRVDPEKDAELFGWYWFYSVVNYHLDTLAMTQAQKAWDQSRIMHEYKAGQVTSARYGYREIETGYCTILGSCDDPSTPWGKPQTRAEYMAKKAAQETLCLRLDLDGYRIFYGLDDSILSDQKLLQCLHEDRARSKFATDEARKESRVWLAEHVDEMVK